MDVAARGPKVKLHEGAVALLEDGEVVADAAVANAAAHAWRQAVEDAAAQLLKELGQQQQEEE